MIAVYSRHYPTLWVADYGKTENPSGYMMTPSMFEPGICYINIPSATLYASHPVVFITEQTVLIQRKTTQVYFNSICHIYMSATIFFTVVPCVLKLSKFFYLPTDAQENCF
jgi:hypothetical protein